tara:strand:+ start:720 stop:1106 length:387 start_codon:yes stop_codon:yes gene_type:complete
MALQISYTDDMGATHSEAYAKIEVIRVKFKESVADLYVYIYHNAAARSKADASTQKKEIIQIPYIITDSAFTTYLADTELLTNGKSLLVQLYTWLKQHNDGPLTHTEPEGHRLVNEGNNINWTTATDV